jgi:riboflavin synthase
VFTGIVEEMGRLRRRDGGRFEFDAALVTEDAGLGDSIAVNGCCLTVVQHGERWFAVDAVDETLDRTNLGLLEPGDLVNLERPVRLADRLGGHLVQGHVDAVGEVVCPAPDLRVRAPSHLLRYVVEKGSITVDGVSLTVVAALDDGFTVAVIPHTVQATTLGCREPGQAVNLEVDLVAKYVERLLEARLLEVGVLEVGVLEVGVSGPGRATSAIAEER